MPKRKSWWRLIRVTTFTLTLCAHSQAFDVDCPDWNLEESFAKADYVFVGRVSDARIITREEKIHLSEFGERTVAECDTLTTFEVYEHYKGESM